MPVTEEFYLKQQTWLMAPEHLPSKRKALSSTPQYFQIKQNKIK
jgi:hypothetical protein